MAIAESITAKVVALAVIVLVVCTCAIPVIMDSQEQIKSTSNNVDVSYRVIDATMTETYEYAVVDGKLYCNGTEIVGFTFPTGGARLYGVFDSDRNLGQVLSSGGIIIGSVLPDVQETVVAADSDKLIYNAGTIQIYTGSTEQTVDLVSYEWAIVPYFPEDSKLGRVAIVGDHQKYVSNDSEIYLIEAASVINSSWTSGGVARLVVTPDGIVKSMYATYVESGTLKTSTDTTGISVSGFTKVDDVHYSFTNLTLTTPAGTIQVYNNAYIPIEYEYISSDDSTLRSLIGILPILLIMIPVLFAARMLKDSRN